SKYLFTLLDAIEYLGGSEEEKPALRVLSLTDIHGRNVYPLVLSMINSYDIAFVLDGGDIVDWGMPFENDFFSGGAGSTWRNNDVSIQDLGVPYYFVRGNHDKESSTVAALRKIPNVVILDKGKIFEQNGLTITGAGDPFFNPDGGINKEDENKEEGELGAQMQEFLDNNPVDIAVLHNPKAAENITHGAEIIFSGHRHKFSFEVPSKLSEPLTLVNDSAGGAGLRTFDNLEGQETQQGFTILNYSADCALQSVVRIQVTSLNGTPELKSTHIPIKSVTEVNTRKCG
ncbi:MAG: hypothetical protein QG593_717, partial [Patescibacteria group bacterium]|nr:hypothetical protein [Patescibacteria group bacterium]